jgi:hypothetical protein
VSNASSKVGAHSVDRDGLHRYLFRKSDAHGRIQIGHMQLAELLHVHHSTITKIMREFLEQGRLRKQRVDVGRLTTYIVVDPETWDPETQAPARRVPTWG